MRKRMNKLKLVHTITISHKDSSNSKNNMESNYNTLISNSKRTT